MPSKSKKLVISLCCISIVAGCMETQGGVSANKRYVASASAKQQYVIRNNAEQRAALTKIYERCQAQYKANLRGVAVMNQVIGGSGGRLINQAAASSAKANQKKCLQEYDRVAAAGRARGFTADPLKEAAARRNKAAMGLLVLLAAGAASGGGGQAQQTQNGRDCILIVDRTGRTRDKCK